MTPRYICIHGHFYQPPREDPWTGEVEKQESAAPFHDWNERITAECYSPNARAGNFERISFNIGPTLLSWLAAHDSETHAAILGADRRGQGRFGGHGPAIAQVYNHIIMPLAKERDRATQVRWGIADFRHRFRREPEGMWLAETAVDIPTLETLAADGIGFTILSPLQARRIRPIGATAWTAMGRGHIDPSRAYRCPLPSGRSIALFFYDGPVSSAIAFDEVLKSGAKLTGRLLDAFHDERNSAQLVHVATDGESYGHHAKDGDRALANALGILEEHPDIQLTTYGEFLAKHPPEYEVMIVEDSAWSCVHGVGRWCDDCGCRIRTDTSQKWRRPLRDALDWLRDQLSTVFEAHGQKWFADPWAARDAFIEVILDRARAGDFLARHANRPVSDSERDTPLNLLDMQHYALLMYTSCGWFFDDIAGLEAVQCLRYAARAMELAEMTAGSDWAGEFRERLALAPSNDAQFGDGRGVWDQLVRRVN
jgi:alpha-amylase/alpha-mannosidase (GH57 family)